VAVRMGCICPRDGGNPLSREERLTKMHQCAARVLPNADIERLIAIVDNLEHASSNDV